MPGKKGKKKGGKKGKKGKKVAGPPIVTTRDILRRREMMQCPGLGDAFSRTMKVEQILEDVVVKTLMKSITKKSTALNLCGMKMSQLPLCMRPIPPGRASHRDSARNIYEFNNNGLHLSGSVESNENMFGGLGNGLSINQCLAATVTHVNLSKNNLFNSEEIFTVLSELPLITHIDLSTNYLNGIMLPDDLPRGAFALLQVLIVDNNNLTGLVVPSVLSGMGVGSASQQPETSNSSAFNAIGNNSTPETVSAVPTRYYRPPGNWKELRIFSAANNALTVIPPETCNWNKLTTLNLRNNKLKVLPGPLLRQWAATLIKLSVGSNNISLCPEDVGICKHLKELDMSYNSISMIPRSLSNCHQLVVLQLGSNSITDIHPDIFNGCVSLKELMLYRNKISALPPEIGNLNVLEKLSLASNNLHSLPEEIGACSNLKELYLNNNAKFSNIPSTAGHLRNLQELAMRKCPALKALPTAACEGMVGLRELDVRAAKKQVCKIAPEAAERLQKQHCTLRGGVVKKVKGNKKPSTAP